MNTKGFELSATIIVLLVISVIIFAGGIIIVKKFFSSAEEIKGEIERSTQEQIESLLREGGLVAIPLNTKTVARGKGGIFGLGVRNIGSEGEFWVAVKFYKAFLPDQKTPISVDEDYINEHWLLYSEEPFSLAPNKYRMIPIAFSVGNSVDAFGTLTTPGTYMFNVCVFKGQPDECNLDAFSVTGFPDNLYSKKVYQISVNVPA
ncbi:MAG: hypothetical protein QW666_03880 [Candidatus Woesearchaeota archaeon]